MNRGRRLASGAGLAAALPVALCQQRAEPGEREMAVLESGIVSMVGVLSTGSHLVMLRSFREQMGA